MLKLCRNTLDDWQTLCDKDGQEIKWDLFKQLVILQENVELHLATKIISYSNNKFWKKNWFQWLNSMPQKSWRVI